ncbi:GDP-mannose 4,6-dehydratase [Pseudoclavibacter helvolus]|uniref:GDP-mannose 4,6-dehydratase n=1 Tax=Pseudoclavibacter helvolus TaxID=255205 RepID=UPI003C724790
MARIMLTGATGQDGSYLLDVLRERGDDVHAVVRSPEEARSLGKLAGVTAHLADLSNVGVLPDLVDEVEPQQLYNIGGFSSVAQSWKEPALAGLVSGVAVAGLLEGASRVRARTGHGARFLQASSCEIFGDGAPAPQSESTPIAPTNPYGAAKAYAQHAVGFARAQGEFAASVILYNHESPRRPLSFVTRKITNGVARIAAGLDSELRLGNLDAKRDWGWAPDYVDAMVRVMNADEPGDYVVATGVSHTVREFVAAAFSAAGVEDWEQYVVIDKRFYRPVDAAETRGDASKLRDDLGWAPTKSFADTVAAMVERDLRGVSNSQV